MAKAELQDLMDGGDVEDGGGRAAAEPIETKMNQGGVRSRFIPQLQVHQVAKSFSRYSSERVTPPKRIPTYARASQINDFRTAWVRAFNAYARIDTAFPA
jgi:hypothetical protein